MSPENRVRAEREARGLTQAALAERSGLSRQSVGAIEAGRAVPGVDVALRLAAALGVPVEGLFGAPSPSLSTWKTPGLEIGARVALAKIQGAWVAHPIREPESPADGLVVAASPEGASIDPLRPPSELEENVLVFGCAAALGLLSGRLSTRPGPGRFAWFARSSTASLAALAGGRAHVAGVHLVDPKTGEANVADVRRAGAAAPIALVALARWEVGLLVRPGTKRRVRSAKDLADPRVRIAGREEGSGAQRLLERTLTGAGVPVERARRVRLPTHLDVARAVQLGAADTGVASRDAAIGLGLELVPLAEERYDLALFAESLADPRIARLLDAIASAEVRRELATLGYDPRPAGTRIAEVA